MKLGAFSILLVLLFAWPAAASSPVAAWSDFVDTLSPAEAEQALKPFNDRDRRRSRYTPGTRGGLPLSGMDDATRAAALALVASVLSDRRREVVKAIIEREAVLGKMEGLPEHRDPDKYYLAVFGSPDDERWGLRFEGHHLSVNVTLTGDDIVSVLPLSLGAKTRPPSPPPSKRPAAFARFWPSFSPSFPQTSRPEPSTRWKRRLPMEHVTRRAAASRSAAAMSRFP